MVSYFACLLWSLKSAKTDLCKWFKSGRKIGSPHQFWFATIAFGRFSDANCKHLHPKFLASFIVFNVRRIWFVFLYSFTANLHPGDGNGNLYFLTEGSTAVWGDITQPALQRCLSLWKYARDISLRLVLQPTRAVNHLRGWLYLKNRLEPQTCEARCSLSQCYDPQSDEWRKRFHLAHFQTLTLCLHIYYFHQSKAFYVLV